MREGKALPYEELRRRNLEKNKKKLEELNLTHLSVTLREAAKHVKRKIPQEGEIVRARRSDRVAQLPPANYKDIGAIEAIERHRRIFKRRCLLGNRVCASVEARLYAHTKADEVQSKLDPKFPSFVKPMLQSHTTRGFWLGLPYRFCNTYLPKCDTTFTLIDEEEEESQTLYLAYKKGLNGGWRGFSIDHELVDGDALVFHLIQPTAFKVHIIRASGYVSS